MALDDLIQDGRAIDRDTTQPATSELSLIVRRDDLVDPATSWLGHTIASTTAATATARIARLRVTDLSWILLAPWRSLLAGLFEGGVNRPFLSGVRRVEVSGNSGPRHLLGGWLLRRFSRVPLEVERDG